LIRISGGDFAAANPASILKAHIGVIPDGTPDPEVLKLAAEAGRVLVSADVKTMPTHFAQFVEHAESPRSHSDAVLALPVCDY
jgi:hypothetical protein